MPITGTTTGTDYAGSRSGWTTVGGSELVLAPQDPRNTAAPAIAGTVATGATLTASPGTWAGTGTIATSYQWQRSAAGSTAWTNIAGATAATYTVPAADEANRLRVVVSAGNWISSVSQAASAAVTKPAAVPPPVDNPPVTNPPVTNPPVTDPPVDNPTPRRPRLSRVRLAPRSFAVAGARTSRKGRRTGTTVSWSLDRAATLRLTVQKRAAKGKRWRTVGTLRRTARQGVGTLRFTGRLGGRALATGQYRLVVAATAGSLTSSTKTVGFKVVRA